MHVICQQTATAAAEGNKSGNLDSPAAQHIAATARTFLYALESMESCWQHVTLQLASDNCRPSLSCHCAGPQAPAGNCADHANCSAAAHLPTFLQVASEINLAFTHATKHGLIVTPFDATVTTNDGIRVFYPYAGEQPATML
jgi:hypothetical protein